MHRIKLCMNTWINGVKHPKIWTVYKRVKAGRSGWDRWIRVTGKDNRMVVRPALMYVWETRRQEAKWKMLTFSLGDQDGAGGAVGAAKRRVMEIVREDIQ